MRVFGKEYRYVARHRRRQTNLGFTGLCRVMWTNYQCASPTIHSKAIRALKTDGWSRASKIVDHVGLAAGIFEVLQSTIMPLPRYTYTGPIDHTIVPDVSQVKSKSVIVTGGANGMGEAMVRAFVAAGAFVTIGDMHPRGAEIENELKGQAVFVKCDIRKWEDQIQLFETAKSRSPANSVDIVIANAGISRSSGDSLWNLTGTYGYFSNRKTAI